MEEEFRRWHIINALIGKHGYSSYLEIGTFTGWNYSQIKCSHKVGVEPNPVTLPGVIQATSDEFFLKNTQKFDIIFIDGLHVWEQCLKDIFNSLKVLNPNGTIVVHDCRPTEFSHTAREAIHPNGEWTGDVWKSIAILRSTYPFAKVAVVDTDWGCGIITPNEDVAKTIRPIDNIFDWYVFQQNQKEILGLISVEEFKRFYL